MNIEVKILEVGDVLYPKHYNSWNEPITITRVTAKRAFVKVNDRYEIQFDREVSSSLARRIGGSASTWSRTNYHLESDKIKAEVGEASARKKLDRLVDFRSRWPIETVNAIIALIETPPHEASKTK